MESNILGAMDGDDKFTGAESEALRNVMDDENPLHGGMGVHHYHASIVSRNAAREPFIEASGTQ